MSRIKGNTKYTHRQTIEARHFQKQEVKLFSVQECWRVLKYLSLKCNFKAHFPREFKGKKVHFSASLLYYSEPLCKYVYLPIYLSTKTKWCEQSRCPTIGDWLNYSIWCM